MDSTPENNNNNNSEKNKKGYSYFYDNPCKSDLIINLKDGSKMHAHTIILSAGSSVFKQMFCESTAFRESGGAPLNINEEEPELVRSFVRLLYSLPPSATTKTEDVASVLANNVSNLFDIYALARRYDAKEILCYCLHYISTTLDTQCNSLRQNLQVRASTKSTTTTKKAPAKQTTPLPYSICKSNILNICNLVLEHFAPFFTDDLAMYHGYSTATKYGSPEYNRMIADIVCDTPTMTQSTAYLYVRSTILNSFFNAYHKPNKATNTGNNNNNNTATISPFPSKITDRIEDVSKQFNTTYITEDNLWILVAFYVTQVLVKRGSKQNNTNKSTDNNKTANDDRDNLLLDIVLRAMYGLPKDMVLTDTKEEEPVSEITTTSMSTLVMKYIASSTYRNHVIYGLLITLLRYIENKHKRKEWTLDEKDHEEEKDKIFSIVDMLDWSHMPESIKEVVKNYFDTAIAEDKSFAVINNNNNNDNSKKPRVSKAFWYKGFIMRIARGLTSSPMKKKAVSGSVLAIPQQVDKAAPKDPVKRHIAALKKKKSGSKEKGIKKAKVDTSLLTFIDNESNSDDEEDEEEEEEEEESWHPLDNWVAERHRF
jgi:hypothetical protein